MRLAAWLQSSSAQELVLLSHRRGVADASTLRNGLQRAGESSRRTLTSRALSDAETLRKLVEYDIDRSADSGR